MDANNTRFQLLLGADDWARCMNERGTPLKTLWLLPRPPDVAWNDSLKELTLRPELFEFTAGAADVPPELGDRRGAGRDVFGNWYTVGADARSIDVISSGDNSVTQFWPVDEGCAPALPRLGTFGPSTPPAAPVPQRLQGAAVTTDHFLVVGTLDPGGLLVFDLASGGGPMHLPWPDVPFAPFDIAQRPGGGVYVLDRDNHCAWELDRHFHVQAAFTSPPSTPPFAFAPVGGGAVDPPPVLSAGASTPVSGDPVAIEAAPGGGFLVLDPSDGVAHYADGARVGAPATLSFTGFDFAVAGDTLYVVDAGGNQSYAFTMAISPEGPALTLEQLFFPMRRFGGKGLVTAGGEAWYDFGDRWIPLVRQPRSRFVESGTLVTPVFDGAEPGCVWHRLLIDAALPPGTSLAVWSKAADEEEGLAIAPWLPEPEPRGRASGPEIPFVDLGPYTSNELLFQQAKGRYLQVKLELIGDGRVSPRIRSLRAWFPRFSYLEHYLPGVYREDAASASFLDRYLANVEGMSTALEDHVAAAQVLFSPQSTPAEDLDWLATWFALALDPLWDERRRRLFLTNAMRFFQARGTMRGVEMALRFVLDRCLDASVYTDTRPLSLATARIVESFRTRRTPGVVFGDPTDLESPRVVTTRARWSPPQGRDALNDAYGASYPIVDPGTPAWRTFSEATLGFVPGAIDPARWQAFLAHRYSNPGSVYAAYGLTGTPPADFSGFSPPAGPELPADGAALVDWFQYESVVVPMSQKAHRFSVLLPWPLRVLDPTGTELTHDQLRDLATRVVDVQKPAHTVFDVKFFWAAFRIGEARLGDDTLLASGSRVPELIEPAVLGRDYVGTSILGGTGASDAIGRPPLPSTSPQETP
ncbi:MAG TPA: phage tail protein [Gaiellaceae bacterium]|nr:phage tail protein [Gaiellaceae bacterium]